MKKPLRDALKRLLAELVEADETVADRLAKLALSRALSRREDSILWARFIQATVEGKLCQVEDDDLRR